MSDETPLPREMPDEMLQAWLRDNPKGTREDGIRDFLLFKAETSGKSVQETTADQFSHLGAMQRVQSRVPVVQGNAPAGHPWRVVDPSQGGSFSDVLSTLGDVAMTASPLSAVTTPARIGQMVARGATMGAGVAAVTGDDAVTGAIGGAAKGLVGQGLGEAIPGTISLGKRLWNMGRNTFATQGNLVKWAEENAYNVWRGAAQEFPETFVRVLDTAKSYTDGLSKLTQAAPGGQRNKMLGEQYLGDAIQRTERMAKTVLGGDDAGVVVPTLRRALMDSKQAEAFETLRMSVSGRNNPSPFDTPMRVRDAFNGLKQMTAEAIQAGRSLESRSLWTAVEQARNELLSRVPKPIAEEYIADLAKYGKGLAFLNALKEGFNSKVTSATKSVFDINGVLDQLQTKGLAEYFPKFNETVLKGAEAGARETIKGGFRARAYKMGESMTINVPGRRPEPLGGSPSRPGHRPSRLITGLTIPGITEMSRATNAPGSYTMEP